MYVFKQYPEFKQQFYIQYCLNLYKINGLGTSDVNPSDLTALLFLILHPYFINL